MAAVKTPSATTTRAQRRKNRRDARKLIREAEAARTTAHTPVSSPPPPMSPVPIPEAAPLLGNEDGRMVVRWAGRDPQREVMPRPVQPAIKVPPVDLPFPRKYQGGLTNAIAEIILAGLRTGMSHRMAAGCALISEITLSKWLHREEEPYITFQQLVYQSETLPKVFLLDSVMSGARMDPYLALDVLGRREHDTFGKPAAAPNLFQQNNFNLGDLLERNGTPKQVGTSSTAPTDPRRKALQSADT